MFYLHIIVLKYEVFAQVKIRKLGGVIVSSPEFILTPLLLFVFDLSTRFTNAKVDNDMPHLNDIHSAQ